MKFPFPQDEIYRNVYDGPTGVVNGLTMNDDHAASKIDNYSKKDDKGDYLPYLFDKHYYVLLDTPDQVQKDNFLLNDIQNGHKKAMNRLALFLSNYFSIVGEFSSIPEQCYDGRKVVFGAPPFETRNASPHLYLDGASFLFGGHCDQLSGDGKMVDQPPHYDIGYDPQEEEKFHDNGCFKPGICISSLDRNTSRDVYIMEGKTQKMSSRFIMVRSFSFLDSHLMVDAHMPWMKNPFLCICPSTS